MIKRARTKDVSSDEDDAEMANLSDIDTDDLDRELELKNIEHDLATNPKYRKYSKAQLGVIRQRKHRKLQEKKDKLASIVEHHTIHRNDRLRKAQYKSNKQRTLLFSSRGVNQRMRHLLHDLRDLIPHSKSEPKFSDKRDVSDIAPLCKMRSCNNCVFLESRKNTDLYLWLSRIPRGPTIKFHVTSVHTMQELKLTGNCLKGSRPILVFDERFDKSPAFRVMKETLSQMFGTPKGHPLSKPFIDRTMTFMVLDHRIWVRNYQLVFEGEGGGYGVEGAHCDPVLVEIGPRFVLQPIRITEGAFSGDTIYQNDHFLNPNEERRKGRKRARKANGVKNKNRHSQLEKMMYRIFREERKKKIFKETETHYRELDTKPVFEKGIDFLE